FLSDTLFAGVGYWLRASSAGQIALSCLPSTSAALAKGMSNLKDLSEYPALVISDSSNAAQTLYFGVELDNPDSKLSYSMPPLPPAGAFDARFDGDYRISEDDVPDESEGEGLIIRIQSSKFPVTLQADNLPELDGSSYIVQEILSGEKGKEYRLDEQGSVVITNPKVKMLKLRKGELVPESFTVDQNYPNPFNPTTTIRYGIPQNEKVEVIIFNTLGQKVRTLVSATQESGYYEVLWDGKNDLHQQVGSGIYFYSVRAGEASAVKKMILLK
ncbi:MAG: T9SS type A sorting domain-containing protein, partial [Calditrichia bacterium]